ncbi:MAG: anthranilate phosphoribosyltransferase, partial [Solirubrobacterales bacterium]
DGLDEMSTAGRTHVVEVTGAGDGGEAEIERYALSAGDVGLAESAPEAVAGGTPEDNAGIARAIFAGEPGPPRDLAVLNAGAAIYVAGVAETIEAGVRAAEAAIDEGAAERTLERFVAQTRDLAAA